jgi:hypothetical protein
MSDYRMSLLKNLETIPTLGYDASAYVAEVSGFSGSDFASRLDSGLLVAARLSRGWLKRSNARALEMDFVAAPRLLHQDVIEGVIGEDAELDHGVLTPVVSGASKTKLGVYFGRQERFLNERSFQVYMDGDVTSDRALALARAAIQCTGLLLVERYDHAYGDIDVSFERYGSGEFTESRTFTSDEFRALAA